MSYNQPIKCKHGAHLLKKTLGTQGEAGLFLNIMLGTSGNSPCPFPILPTTPFCCVLFSQTSGTDLRQKERLFEYQHQWGFSALVTSSRCPYDVSTIEHLLYSLAVIIIRGIRIDVDGSYEANWTTTGFSFIPSIIGKAIYSASSVEPSPYQFSFPLPSLLLNLSSYHRPPDRYAATAA